MRPGAIVLNVARGGVVDEAALADALRSGHLGGAGIDVFATEPPAGSPLLEAPNTVLTPHLGASTSEAQVRVAEEAAQQVLDVLAGRPARYAVNAPLLTPETADALAPFLPLAQMLGQLYAQFARGIGSLTLEVAGELAALRSRPAGRGGPAWRPRDRDRRAGDPGQRAAAGPRPWHQAHRASHGGCRSPRLPHHARGRRHGRWHRRGRRRAAPRPAG